MAGTTATRTLVQMLDQATAILTAVAAHPRIQAAEVTKITTARTSITTNRGRVTGATVPSAQRNTFRTQLLAQVAAILPAETRLGLRSVDFYDALDLLQDCAAAGGAGLSSVRSTLGDPADPVVP